MSLYVDWLRLSDEFDEHVSQLTNFVANRSVFSSAASFTIADECLLEGHLSRVWQIWCNFWRSCICHSCTGTTDGNAVAVVAHHVGATEVEVSSAVIRAKKNTVPYWQSSNSVLRFEPTWGDADVLATVISRIVPSNHLQLLAAVSSAHSSAKTLQTIRNCAAHTNPQTLSDVKAFSTAYASFPISQAVHALFWVEPSTNDFLIIHAIENLRDSALAAIS